MAGHKARHLAVMILSHSAFLQKLYRNLLVPYQFPFFACCFLVTAWADSFSGNLRFHLIDGFACCGDMSAAAHGEFSDDGPF